MRVKVDMESDALYFRLSEEDIVENEETSPGGVLDYDKNGRVVGMDLQKSRTRLDKFNIEHV